VAEAMTGDPGQVTAQVVIGGVMRTLAFACTATTRAIALSIDGRTSLGAIHRTAAPALSWEAFCQEFNRLHKPLYAIGEMFLSTTPDPASIPR
jgi:hypothetical protein